MDFTLELGESKRTIATPFLTSKFTSLPEREERRGRSETESVRGRNKLNEEREKSISHYQCWQQC
jgi:hypothetical protein